MKKLELFFLIIIILVAFTVRLYKIDRPVADWHSWRQADTAAVARNFVKERFNIFFPQADSILIINEKGLPNPNRYFINEFPLYNAIVAIFYKIFDINTAIARLVSVFFATLGTLFLYLISRKLFDQKVATLATLFYALNPYNIFYGSVIMPDPTFIAFSIISIYLCLLFVEKKNWICAISLGIALSLALLVKPYAVFLLIPITYWMFSNWGISTIKNLKVYAVALVAFAPLVLWRIHIMNHPEGAFASTWLLNGGNIRFTGAFFRWLIFERLNRLIFATGGFVLFVIGIIFSPQTKTGLFIFSWLISVVLYMIIFAKGNVTHDYYQIPILPVGSILVSLGFFSLINIAKNFSQKVLNCAIAVSLITISFAFGWYEVRGYFNINRPAIVEAGKRVDALLPKDAMVVADYQGDPAFLYQTNRYGLPVVDRPLNKLVESRIKYLVTVDVNNLSIINLAKKCKIIEITNNYVIIELSNECLKS